VELGVSTQFQIHYERQPYFWRTVRPAAKGIKTPFSKLPADLDAPAIEGGVKSGPVKCMPGHALGALDTRGDDIDALGIKGFSLGIDQPPDTVDFGGAPAFGPCAGLGLKVVSTGRAVENHGGRQNSYKKKKHKSKTRAQNTPPGNSQSLFSFKPGQNYACA
jgi:hypothetical protein